jgi:hypothetical protein
MPETVREKIGCKMYINTMGYWAEIELEKRGREEHYGYQASVPAHVSMVENRIFAPGAKSA